MKIFEKNYWQVSLLFAITCLSYAYLVSFKLSNSAINIEVGKNFAVVPLIIFPLFYTGLYLAETLLLYLGRNTRFNYRKHLNITHLIFTLLFYLILERYQEIFGRIVDTNVFGGRSINTGNEIIIVIILSFFLIGRLAVILNYFFSKKQSSSFPDTPLT